MTEDGGGPRQRSVSQYKTYMGCPERYFLERVAKAPQRPAVWSFQGSAIHDALEQWERAGRSFGTAKAVEVYYTSFDAYFTALREKWPDDSAWMTGGNLKFETDYEKRRADGARQVEEYIEKALSEANEWRPLPTPDGPAAEVEFVLPFGGVPVRGFIDSARQYRDGSIKVVDYKSGSKKPESDLQLAVYSEAIEHFTGQKPSKASYYMTRNGKEHEAMLERWSPELIGDMFASMDAMERAGHYAPNPQDGCERICPVAQFCRVKGHPESAAQYHHIKEDA